MPNDTDTTPPASGQQAGLPDLAQSIDAVERIVRAARAGVDGKVAAGPYVMAYFEMDEDKQEFGWEVELIVGDAERNVSDWDPSLEKALVSVLTHVVRTRK